MFFILHDHEDNRSTNELTEVKFSSELVHRHIFFD